jgi:hypothetical protein
LIGKLVASPAAKTPGALGATVGVDRDESVVVVGDARDPGSLERRQHDRPIGRHAFAAFEHELPVHDRHRAPVHELDRALPQQRRQRHRGLLAEPP